MVQVLFEEPFYLALVTVPILLVIAGIWTRTRSQGATRAMLIAVGLSAGLFVLQALLVTDKERLQQTVRRMSDWVENDDITRIIEIVDPNCSIEGAYTRDDFERQLNRLLDKYTIHNASVGSFEIEVHGKEATLTCNSSCMVQTAQMAGHVPARWELVFKQTQDEWLIYDIKPLHIAGRQYSSFMDIP